MLSISTTEKSGGWGGDHPGIFKSLWCFRILVCDHPLSGSALLQRFRWFLWTTFTTDNMERAAFSLLYSQEGRKEAHVVSTHNTCPTPLLGFLPQECSQLTLIAHLMSYLWSISLHLPFISTIVISLSQQLSYNFD